MRDQYHVPGEMKRIIRIAHDLTIRCGGAPRQPQPGLTPDRASRDTAGHEKAPVSKEAGAG
jgi:hypothetical protein